jgi:hypothetical protein
MMRTLTGLLLLAVLTVGCETKQSSASPRTEDRARIAAANAFTELYARSRLSQWNIHAKAAGPTCDVLFVDTAIVLEDSMIEAMHFGAGAYDISKGGVQQFYQERAFRGVAYKDGSGRIWTYGAVTIPEAEAMKPCGTNEQ